MITFKKFLSEEIDLDEVLEKIQQDCMPWLMKTDRLAFRGINIRTMPKFFTGEAITARQPTNTPDDISAAADGWFLDHFGWRARSEGLFVTGDYAMARDYGKVYMIFPIGDFKFIWSQEVHDMFAELSPPRLDPDRISKVLDNLSNAEYTNKSLTKALESSHEIMISCESYYALEYSYRFTDKFKARFGESDNF